jgi:hypothetical protein
MSYNGSGTFQINTSGQPVVAGTVISSTAFNALTADLATGLSTAITKDGQTTTTARIIFAQGIRDSTLTASSAVATDASKNLVSVTNTGTGNNVLATSPTLVTPVLGAASATSITVDAGAVGTPSITTAGDTNTGIFFPAADTIAFAEGGAESMRITSAGNVGIGTSSPGAKLDVLGADSSTSGTIYGIYDQLNTTSASGSGAKIGIQTFANAQTGYAGTGALIGGVLTAQQGNASVNTGNLIGARGQISTSGAGTINSAVAVQTSLSLNSASTIPIIAGLQVNAITCPTAGTTTAYGVQVGAITNSTATYGFWSNIASGATQYNFYAAGTADNYFAGNVGIGTSSPSYRLQVSAASNTLGGYFYTPSGLSGIRIETAANDKAVAEFYTNGNRNWSIGPGQTTAGAFEFRDVTDSSTRMLIDSSGNLLLNRTSPVGTERLCVEVGGSKQGQIIRSTDTSGNPQLFRISSGQNSGAIGTGRFITCDDGGGDKFFVAGSGVVNSTSTSITSISDFRLKENVRVLDTGLDSVMALKPRRFDWKEGQGTNKKNVAGFIAQEVETVLPDLIGEWKNNENDETTYKSLSMGDMLPTLVKAIQEQQALITALTARITALENK